MKKSVSFIVALFAFAVCSNAFALVNWGEDDFNRQMKDTFNKTDGTGLSIGGLNTTGTNKSTGVEYADGGVDRSTAAVLAVGATNASGVTITPATTITGAVTNSALTASTALTANSSKVLTSSSTTDTELSYIHGLTSPTGTGAIVAANTPTLITPVLGVATGTSVIWSGASKFNTSIFADGDTETSSVLLSSSTSLGTGNMSFSDIFKSIGGSADATALHNGVGGGQISRFHVITPTIPSGGSWVITPDTSLNITSFTMSTARSELTLIYVNSTLGWQPMGACNAVTIAYKATAQ